MGKINSIIVDNWKKLGLVLGNVAGIVELINAKAFALLLVYISKTLVTAHKWKSEVIKVKSWPERTLSENKFYGFSTHDNGFSSSHARSLNWIPPSRIWIARQYRSIRRSTCVLCSSYLIDAYFNRWIWCGRTSEWANVTFLPAARVSFWYKEDFVIEGGGFCQSGVACQSPMYPNINWFGWVTWPTQQQDTATPLRLTTIRVFSAIVNVNNRVNKSRAQTNTLNETTLSDILKKKKNIQQFSKFMLNSLSGLCSPSLLFRVALLYLAALLAQPLNQSHWYTMEIAMPPPNDKILLVKKLPHASFVREQLKRLSHVENTYQLSHEHLNIICEHSSMVFFLSG